MLRIILFILFASTTTYAIDRDVTSRDGSVVLNGFSSVKSQINGTTKTTLNSLGYLGIGTLLPEYLLDVRASGSAAIAQVLSDGQSANMFLRSYRAAGNQNKIVAYGNRGSVASPSQSLANDYALEILGYGKDETVSGTQTYGRIILGSDNAAPTSTSSPGTILFRTTPSGSINDVERMRITNSGNVLFSGSTGSTTLDQSANFQFNGYATIARSTSLAGVLNFYNSSAPVGGKYFRLANVDAGALTIEKVNDSYTTPTELMRVDSAGGVTIAGLAGTGTRAISADLNGKLVPATVSAPTIQKFLSGSGTYFTPAGVSYIKIQLVGGGGGGDGVNGGKTAGGNTTFGGLIAGGGAAGGARQGAGAAGGTATGGNVANVAGGQGGTASYNGSNTIGSGFITFNGGHGGSSVFGGAGAGGSSVGGGGTGGNGAANSGAGGGGGGSSTNASNLSGGWGGGGAGGYVEHIQSSPSASYPYSVGAGGTGSASASGGAGGGNGGSGVIIVTEYY